MTVRHSQVLTSRSTEHLLREPVVCHKTDQISSSRQCRYVVRWQNHQCVTWNVSRGSEDTSLGSQGQSVVSAGCKVVSWKCKHYTKPTHTSHLRTRDFSRLAQVFESSSQQESLCLTSMSHAPSLLFLSHLSTISPSRCTTVRPSIRPSTRPSLMSISHGDLPCKDPSNVSFGHLAETHSPTGYEPKDLTEEDRSNRCSSTDRV